MAEFVFGCLQELAELDADLSGVQVGWEFELALGGQDFRDLEVDLKAGNIENGLGGAIGLRSWSAKCHGASSSEVKQDLQ